MTSLKDTPKPIQETLLNDRVFIDALFKRPESMAKLFSYDSFIEGENIFVNKDGSLGCIFEANLLQHEAMTSQDIIQTAASLKSWFNLPENCTLQILFDQSYISKLDEKFIEYETAFPESHPVSRMLYEKRLNLIMDNCAAETDLSPFERKTLVSIRYFPTVGYHSLYKDVLNRGEVTLFKEMAHFTKELTSFKHLMANFEANSKVKLIRLNAASVLDHLRRFFNPKTYYKRSFAQFNPNIPISEQIIYNNPVLDYSGMEREGLKTRTLSLKTSPQYAYPGGMAYFTRLSFPFKITLNFSFPTKTKIKQFFDIKEFFLQNTPSARAKRQREEVLEIQDRLARDDRCLHMTFNVILDGETEEILDRRSRELINVFQNDLECEVIVEDDIGLGLCFNSLPLAYSPKADLSAQRFIRILRSDAVNFVPVFDSFQGLKNPLQLYLSRENNLIRFSLTENETSNHTVVLADSGSGKSAFIIDCMQAAKRTSPEPLLFVIDKKSSYLMLSEYFDANLTVFDRSHDLPFSPFRGFYDEEKIAFLTNLIISGIKLTSSSFQTESDHIAVISRAIRAAYEKKQGESGLVYQNGELVHSDATPSIELTMDDVVAALSGLTADPDFEKYEKAVSEVIQKMGPFYGDGIYAKFFRGSARKDKTASKLFYIYDLDALDSDPILQALMTMSVVEEIRQTIKLPENRGRGGFVILEELGMIGGDNPNAARFIKDAAETFRKLGFWLISLTPRPQNYFEIEAGRAMWGVADNFIFLQMSEDNVRYVQEHSSLLDEANAEIVKSLRTIRGKYADIFYMNKKKTYQGAFRYFQTPLDRWLAPTNAKDMNAATSALKKFPGEKWKALHYLAENLPKGAA